MTLSNCFHVTLKRQNVGDQHWYKCDKCGLKFIARLWDGKVVVREPVEYPSSPQVTDMPDEKTLPRHVMWAELKRRRLAEDPEYFGSEVKPRTGEGS